MKVLETKGLDFNAMDKDLTLLLTMFIERLNKPFLLSKVMTKFCELVPYNTYKKNPRFAPVVFGVKNGAQTLVEHKAIEHKFVEGKNYRLVKIVNEKIISKVTSKDFEVLPMTKAEAIDWIDEVIEELKLNEGGGEQIVSDYDNSEVAVNSLF